MADDRVRKVTPDGIIHAFAGTGVGCVLYGAIGTCCNSGDGGPALSAQVCGGGNYGKIAVGPDGSVYLAQPTWVAIRRVRPDGIIERFAGTTYGFSGDGGNAKAAQLAQPEGVSVGPDGSVYIADTSNQRIRRVSPTGVIETVAGSGPPSTFSGDGGPAAAAKLYSPWQSAVGPSGELYIADSWNARVRKIGAPLPGFTLADITIASKDGGELYVFSASRRHLRTLDARTKAVVYSFGYDDAGRLASITDRDGQVTTIERAGGVPTAIVAPHGQRTMLSVDGNGYLSRITNPASESLAYSYDADGLMQTFTDPRGKVHSFHYDAVGRLLLDENPAGGFKQLERSDCTDGYSVSVTTALGRTTLHDVKPIGTGDEVRTTTRPDGTGTVSTEYTSGTKRVVSTDGTTSTVTLRPDPQFGMQSPLAASAQVTTPAGLTRSVSQAASVVLTNPADILSVKTRADQVTVNGRTSTASYDAAARTITTTTAAGRKVVVGLDSTGRPATVQLPGVPQVAFERDLQGQLRTVTQGTRVIGIEYDGAGQPWRITDSLGRVIELSYDGAGRVTSQVLPGSRAVGFGRDATGNVTSVVPPGRPAHGFTYTATDAIESYRPPVASSTGLLGTTYGYDLDGALAQVLLPDESTIVPGYDTAGRLASVTSARGTTVVGYDTVGRLKTLVAPDGGIQTFGYDGSLRTSETRTGAVAGTVRWGYDNDFRVASVSVNGAAVSYQYDSIACSRRRARSP